MAAFDLAESRFADQHATVMIDESVGMPVHLLKADCREPHDAMFRSVAYALKEKKVA